MARVRLSMRWWLAALFAAIAAVTAFSVAEVFNHRAATALHAHARELVVGQSVSAARAISRAVVRGSVADAAAIASNRQGFSVYVFSPDGKPLTGERSRNVAFVAVPGGRQALRAALHGERYVATVDRGRSYVIGLRLRGGTGALVTYAQRPEVLRELGIVHNQILDAAVIAVAVGGLVGLLVAIVIGTRLRRIARAAARIEAGGFDVPLRSSFGDEVGALAETINQMRERLRESFGQLGQERDRLRQLLEGLHEGVIAVDDMLRISFANNAARALLTGRALSIGAPLPDLWPDFPLRSFATQLFTGLDRPVQARIVEEERTIALVGVPTRGGSDAILVLADVSERERRERAEREFVTNAAHELGTPLTAISTSLEVLEQGAKDNPAERDRFLELIERQTARLGRLRRALLALARTQTRQQAPQLEPVAATQLLDSVAADLDAGEAAIVVDCPDDLLLLAHPELAEQVLFNLADNALRHGSPTRVELVARAFDDATATIDVRDNGTGIRAGERDRLFDRFYRGSPQGDGFGLGLAIVREAVRALGGTIELDSPPEGGTHVRITLARAQVPVA